MKFENTLWNSYTCSNVKNRRKKMVAFHPTNACSCKKHHRNRLLVLYRWWSFQIQSYYKISLYHIISIALSLHCYSRDNNGPRFLWSYPKDPELWPNTAERLAMYMYLYGSKNKNDFCLKNSLLPFHICVDWFLKLPKCSICLVGN